MSKNKQNENIPFENVDDLIDIGLHIAYYRNKKNMRQKDLATAVGVSQAYISRIESRNEAISFSMNLFISICRALNVKPIDMFRTLP